MKAKLGCPICKSFDTEVVYRNSNSSFSHADLRFNLNISLCHNCAFVFQSSAYTDRYEALIKKVYTTYRKKNDNFLFPRRCPDYIDTVNMIIKNLPKQRQINILEIGSNRGDMLFLIKEKNPNVNVIGIEPTKFEELQIPTINAFFSKELFSNKFDAVIMQHVLEHIKYPTEIMQGIGSILTDGGIFYIEVPNLENTLRYFTEDFIGDHVNYFSPKSLVMTLEGFKVIKSSERPFLRVIAMKSKTANKKQHLNIRTTKLIKDSFNSFRSQREQLIKRIIKYSWAGKKIVFYGVSSYFRVLFQELKNTINCKNCFYYDDNFKADREGTFGLRRLSKFNKNTVVIICSNVYRVQEAIENRLKNCKDLSIAKPWSGILENNKVILKEEPL